MYSNARKIFNCTKSTSDEVVDCLNGIRVLSLVWIILGHSQITSVLGPLTNRGYLVEVRFVALYVNCGISGKILSEEFTQIILKQNSIAQILFSYDQIHFFLRLR